MMLAWNDGFGDYTDPARSKYFVLQILYMCIWRQIGLWCQHGSAPDSWTIISNRKWVLDPPIIELMIIYDDTEPFPKNVIKLFAKCTVTLSELR